MKIKGKKKTRSVKYREWNKGHEVKTKQNREWRWMKGYLLHLGPQKEFFIDPKYLRTEYSYHYHSIKCLKTL